MRQVLSWRFAAAIAAVVVLTLLINVALADRGTIAQLAGPTGETPRRADLVSLVFEIDQEDFTMLPNGRAQGELTLTLPPDERQVRIYQGTPGEVTCTALEQFGQCALLAELLGDTITWFALVPMGRSFRFELPAIESLDGGYAHLVNGWQVPYASIIDRSRCESPAESFGEFLRTVGPAHTSLFDLGRGEIFAVQC